MADRHRSVEEFLASLSAERRGEVTALREVVSEAEPRLVEIVKWNSPSYTLAGVDRLTINAAGRGPVRLILHLGVATAEDTDAAPTFDGDPDGLLAWHSDIRASLTMPDPDELPGARGAMIRVIRAWLGGGAANGTA